MIGIVILHRSSSKNEKIEPSYDLGSPLLDIYPKEIKTRYQRNVFTFVLIAAFFTIAKIWKQLKCLSTDEWIKKM